jgi:hypothetical protein
MNKLRLLVVATIVSNTLSAWAFGAETVQRTDLENAAQDVNFSLQNQDTGSRWNFYPDAHGNVELEVTPLISFLARPDLTVFNTGEKIMTTSWGIRFSVL